MSDRRKYNLPIFIETFDKPDSWNQDYTINNIKDIEKVKEWYQNLGIEIIDIRHINPAIGPERDEIEAYYPDRWEEVGHGSSPWVDVINAEKQVMFSMFVKKAPWDYCFFTRPKKGALNDSIFNKY